MAFFSGIAASYALARNLNAALPGVAIAAALVPPIATAGIAFAFGEIDISAGASLLFATNVVAIILGSSICFYALGLRRLKTAEAWSRRLLSGLLVATLVLSVPLSVYLWQVRASTPVGLRSDIESRLAEHPSFELAMVEREDNVIRVTLNGPTDVPPELLKALKTDAIQRAGWAAEVIVITRMNRTSRTMDDDWHLQMRRLVERDEGYRFVNAHRRAGKIEVEVEGRQAPSYTFLDDLRRFASNEGLGELRLRLTPIHEVKPENGIRQALLEALDEHEGFRLRLMELTSEEIRLELEAPRAPSSALLGRLKQIIRSRLRREIPVKIRILRVELMEL